MQLYFYAKLTWWEQYFLISSIWTPWLGYSICKSALFQNLPEILTELKVTLVLGTLQTLFHLTVTGWSCCCCCCCCKKAGSPELLGNDAGPRGRAQHLPSWQLPATAQNSHFNSSINFLPLISRPVFRNALLSLNFL